MAGEDDRAMREHRMWRRHGASKREARLKAVLYSVIDDERQARERGPDWEGKEVKQSIVHARQDLILVVGLLRELLEVLESIRIWLIFVVVLLLALVGVQLI